MGAAQMITQVVSFNLKPNLYFLFKFILDSVIDVFNMNKIILAPNAASGTVGAYFLGRPWKGKRKQDSNSTHEFTP